MVWREKKKAVVQSISIGVNAKCTEREKKNCWLTKKERMCFPYYRCSTQFCRMMCFFFHSASVECEYKLIFYFVTFFSLSPCVLVLLAQSVNFWLDSETRVFFICSFVLNLLFKCLCLFLFTQFDSTCLKLEICTQNKEI